MIRRLSIYLKEMFPLPAFAGSVALVFAVILILGRLSGYPPEFNHLVLLVGIAVTSVSLLIRIMDEFKDYEDDLINFPDRPLPSGRVKPIDLKVLGWICVLTQLFISFYIDPRALFIWSVLVLFFAFLMLKWFFIENKMRTSLLLAFFSHHPIVFLNYIYILIAALSVFPGGVREGVARFLLPLCFVFTNWEISRKIRSPEDETEYNTYSKVVGPRPSIFVTILLQLFVAVAMLIIFNELNSPLWLRALYCAVTVLLIVPYLRYARDLKLIRPLKTMAELQIFALLVFLFITVLV